jgi:hypothetical protein
MTVGICSASTVCCLNHKASLRKNNVVRYKVRLRGFKKIIFKAKSPIKTFYYATYKLTLLSVFSTPDYVINLDEENGSIS